MSRASKIDPNDVAGGKDMGVLREKPNTRAQHEMTHYELRDYSLKHRVHMYRDLNEEANRDMIFRLVVDDYEVLLDAEEVARCVRWV